MGPRAGTHLEADDVLTFGVAAGDLDCIVDRLAAAVGEEESRQAGRCDVHHAIQQSHLRPVWLSDMPPQKVSVS